MPRTASTFDAVLLAFQQGDPHVRETLPVSKSFKKNLLDLACREAGDLPFDILEDVIQRVWELLLRPDLQRFDPNRGSAAAYLRQVVKRAATDVRAENSPPGQRTRLYKDYEGQVIIQTPARSLEARLGKIDDEIFTLHDIIPTPGDPFEQFHKQEEAKWFLELATVSASPEISEALNLIYYREMTLTEAAQEVQVHRSTLRRRIDRWLDFHSLALAA